MLLTHPLLVEVMTKLFSSAQSDLLNSPIGHLTATQAHARMLALKDIRASLESVLNDEKVAAATADRNTGSL